VKAAVELSNDTPKATAMTIFLSDLGKRFNREWVFRHFNYEFKSGHAYAITGSNGSGKSTLLQVVGGMMMSTEGKLDYKNNDAAVSSEEIFREISFCAPYFELIEEMTLLEFMDFHGQFKPFIAGIDSKNIPSLLGLEHSAHKQIRYFSSGMKQRVKLAQSFFSDAPVLLLDEPCTNLDLDGIGWYHSLVEKFSANRILIISSNDKVEFEFCKEKISMGDFK
jgi:ABC-type multidrug transport system ATPase subunit